MRKIVLLIAMGAFFLSTKSQAQQFVASFGTYHHWGIPDRIHHTLAYDFYNYDIVHVNRVSRGGYLFFDILLQRGNVFVEVNIGRYGRIVGRTFFDRYPLYNHVCSGHCGYHATYYNINRNVCSSHNHHGHNHVNVYNNINHGNAYGHHKKGYKKHYKSNAQNVHYPVRRGRYHDSHRSRSGHYTSRDDFDRDNGKRKVRKGDRNNMKTRREHYSVD